jgi:hypothetical protein
MTLETTIPTIIPIFLPSLGGELVGTLVGEPVTILVVIDDISSGSNRVTHVKFLISSI